MAHSKSLNLRTFWVLIAATFAACFAAAVSLPHDPYIRYQAMKGTIFERAKWIYERSHFDDAPIDILFIGSSRTARGVISPEIEANLAERGFDKKVANFSLPASGLDIRLALAREAMENREIEYLVISLVEQFPRDGHQAFADLATAGDVLKSPLLVNRNLPENLARLPVRQIQLSFASILPEAFGYQDTFDPAAYAGTTIDPRIFNPGNPNRLQTSADIEALEKESAFRRRDLTRPILPENMAWIEFGVPRTYIQRLADLAEDNGTKLIFLYLPFYGGFSEPFEKEWIEQFGPVLSGTFLIGDPENYNDVAHVSEHGANLVGTWLSNELVQILEQSEQ